MTSFRQFRQILAENVEQLDETNRRKASKVTYHDVKLDNGSSIRVQKHSFGYSHDKVKGKTFNTKDEIRDALNKAVQEGVEIMNEVISEEEEKEYTVVADISHPFNRGLSVTKHFKHKAKSPEHAVKAAKDHIKSQGWKVHSASVRGNVSEESIDLIDAIEEATAEAEQIDELSTTTLKSYIKKAYKSSEKHYAKSDQEEDKAMSTDGGKYPEKQARHQANANKHIHKYFNRKNGIRTADQKVNSK